MQRRTLIKICGLTCSEDAAAAVAAGADAIGLVFYPPSARAVDIAKAQAVLMAVPPFVTVVGLFVNPEKEQVDDVLAQVPLDMLQFHGDESPAFCAGFERPWLKAVAMRAGVRLDEVGERYCQARGLLLDAWQEGMPGGTGKAFDWQGSWGQCHQPRVLAGGLNPDNVVSAMAQLAPDAVDVSSGVEWCPGRKDSAKMKAFVQAVRGFDNIKGAASG